MAIPDVLKHGLGSPLAEGEHMRIMSSFSWAVPFACAACCALGVPACKSNAVPSTPAQGGRSNGGNSPEDSGQAAGGCASGTCAAGAAGAGGGLNPANGASFQERVIVDGLASPWELTWGPDGWLWVTERTGKRVVRIRPDDGTRSVALELEEARQDSPQDGLLGMALHPQLLASQNRDFVYVAFSYEDAAGRRFQIRRYTYDVMTSTLVAPVTLLSGLPASTDHNSGRLLIGPDDKLYYSIGNQGENQFDRKCNPDRAQELPTQSQIEQQDYQTYQGKILRMNLDGSIPDDNPTFNGVRSHIFTLGHRNAQGLAFGPTGALFSDEQGPKSDDELNRIEPGKNYGWPYVAGFQDDRAYSYGNWSAAPNCKGMGYEDYDLPDSVPQQKESAWVDPNFMPPLMTFYTVAPDYSFRDPKCGNQAYICWPTIAPSSLEFYSSAKHALTGWTDSLLLTSLKHGTVYRVALSPDGQGVTGDATPLFKTTNRYRDVAVNPDGQTFYVITDSEGLTGSTDGGATDALENEGSVLEFKAAPLD
jgi:PQQ-dependent dehydrogenase (s-GDH family)